LALRKREQAKSFEACLNGNLLPLFDVQVWNRVEATVVHLGEHNLEICERSKWSRTILGPVNHVFIILHYRLPSVLAGCPL
jgi:hypothetical protein